VPEAARFASFAAARTAFLAAALSAVCLLAITLQLAACLALSAVLPGNKIQGHAFTF
jgi:hypothetical protein